MSSTHAALVEAIEELLPGAEAMGWDTSKVRAALAQAEAAPKTLTDEQIDRIAENCAKSMPDGIRGFCVTWGWRQFARELLDVCAGHQRAQAEAAQPVAGWRLVPMEPTPAMLACIVRRDYPADWEAGKRLQSRQRGENRVPFKSEYECAVGQYERLLAAAPQPAEAAPFARHHGNGAEAAPKQEAVAPMSDQQATLLNQAHDMLLEHADEQRKRGNDSAAAGAECSAAAVLELGAAWSAAQPQQPAPEPVALPKDPPPGLLMSMAIRYDHALGMPGYYDSELLRSMSGVTHAQRLESTLRTMRQLYEEVSGHGFYRPEREAEYAARAAAPQTPAGEKL